MLRDAGFSNRPPPLTAGCGTVDGLGSAGIALASVALLLGLSAITVPWNTLMLSVVL